MHIISTQSIIMLIFFGVIGASFIIFEAVRLQKRLRHKEQLFKKAYHCWIEVSTDFIDWRIKPQNKSHTPNNPQYQWHLRCELAMFERVILLKQVVTEEDRKYLHDLKRELRTDVAVEEPPRD